MARATLEALFRIDVRPILPTITAPTLVIHAREDRCAPVQGGRYLADHIPGARLLEVEGVDHAFWFTEPDRILTGIEEFLTGSHAAPSQLHRALRTVLFTDMVASTQRAAAAGDERWRAVLQRFGDITADVTARFDGTVVKSTGDGHLMTFDGPTQAIRCAEALRADAETLGIEIRAGIHTGECELLDTDIGGIAVHIAARILGQAGAGEILVSRTVRDLVVGSGTGFEDRGNVELRGVPGSWQLLAVDRHGARSGSAEAELASMSTPGPRTAMRRSDRAVEVVARRTPWIMRGIARLAPATVRSKTATPRPGLRPAAVALRAAQNDGLPHGREPSPGSLASSSAMASPYGLAWRRGICVGHHRCSTISSARRERPLSRWRRICAGNPVPLKPSRLRVPITNKLSEVDPQAASASTICELNSAARTTCMSRANPGSPPDRATSNGGGSARTDTDPSSSTTKPSPWAAATRARTSACAAAI